MKKRATLGLLVGVQALFAQGAEPPLYETVITAPLASRLPLSRSRIGREEIESTHATSIHELLKTEPGIDFVSERAGGQASLFLRGGESSHSLVLIDGVPVNDPSDPSRRFEFTHLDPMSIESIEILRGPESIAYGSDALSGVISIRTKRIPIEANPKPVLRAHQEYGTFETFRSSGGFSARPATNIGYDFHAIRHSTEGYSSADVQGGDRDSRERIGVGGRIEWEPAPSHKLSLDGGWDQLREDLDAGAKRDDPNSKSDSRSLSARVDAEGPILPEERLAYHADYSFHRIRRSLDDPIDASNPFGFSTTYLGTAHEGGARVSARISETARAHLGGSLRKESAYSLGSETLPVRGQTSIGGFALLEFDPAPQWKLDAGGRLDRVSGVDSSEWTGRVGAGFDALESLHLFAGGGTGFKAPSLYQRFAPHYGTQALTPERSVNAELGVRAWKELSASGFYTRYQNLIDFDSATSHYRNGGKAEVLGLELKQDSRMDAWVPGLSVQNALTAMRAKSLVTGLELPRRARWKFGSRVQYAIGMISIGVEPAFTGPRRDASSATSGTLASSLRFDAFVGITPLPWLDFGFRAEDLFDRKAPEALGYTAPGRLLTASLSARL